MKTYRSRFRDRRPPQKGRGVKDILDVIHATPIEPEIINPDSKFVVVTYWWGIANKNANLQRPCPEEIIDVVSAKILEEEREKDPKMAKAFARVTELDQKDELDEEEEEEYYPMRRMLIAFRNDLFARKDIQTLVLARRDEEVARLTAAGEFTPPRPYREMIEEWKASMRSANCNFVAANTEFPLKSDYQFAINGKPVFIKKVLDAVKDRGMGVLYIDGDMFIRKYPHIFDIQNVDFMARGWNMDPRDGRRYLKDGGYFNPYIFETSGGTMYFGNTEGSRKILDKWIDISAQSDSEGKADDRLLSMVYTVNRLVVGTNIISLPIEYLWLTDKYATRFKEADPPATKDGAIIEHPACLTGEERATEGSSIKNRQPLGYEALENVVDTVKTVETGLLYEYIYFPTPEMAEGMRPWLKYQTFAVQKYGSTKGFTVVPYDQRYGEFTAVADENIAKAKEVNVGPKVPVIRLDRETPIPVILAHLTNGCTVVLGKMPEAIVTTLAPEIDFAGFNRGSLGTPENFQPNLIIPPKSPMVLRPTNPVLVHLIRMCKTLDDINTHLKDSYMFLSRIRWKVVPTEALKPSRPFGETK